MGRARSAVDPLPESDRTSAGSLTQFRDPFYCAELAEVPYGYRRCVPSEVALETSRGRCASPTESPRLADFKVSGAVKLTKDLNKRRHKSAPSGLVTGTNASPCVAVEVLVEEHQIAPVRVIPVHLRIPVDRSSALSVP